MTGKNTIVFDILDNIVSIVDPRKDRMRLLDIKKTYQFYCRFSQKVYLFTFTEMFNRICMEEKLRRKSLDHELVIFSVLPSEIVYKIMDKLPFVKKYVSHVLGREHCLQYKGLILKDLMLLEKGRISYRVIQSG